MLGTIGDILINGGVQLLGNTVKGTTELGLRKLGDLVKDKTGIDMFNGSILNNGLTPDQILALKKLEHEQYAKILEINVEYAKINAAEADSARELQKVTVQSDTSWFAKHYVYLLATMLILTHAFVQIYVVINGIPESQLRVTENILNSFTNTSGMIIGFFFGNRFNNTTIDTTSKTHIPITKPDK